MDIIAGILNESYFLLKRMAPYLLFGYFFAGALHIFVKTETVGRHLGTNSFFSVLKASLFGIPLPLCSCSVIPAAMSLRKEGASKGSVLSFLISTPTTGVDSIFATYSLLGPFFTFYRVIASFVAGVFSGSVANLLLKQDDMSGVVSDVPKCGLCNDDNNGKRNGYPHSHGIIKKITGVFKYAFGDLLNDTGPALLLGIIIGGIITFFMPEKFIEDHLGTGFLPMIVMLAVGIPMYVCANASIPIAVSLMLKGLSPGAAFVFLVAGPATNIVTMTVIARNMGKGALVIYLASISLCGVLMGWFLNIIWSYFPSDHLTHMAHGKMMLPEWLAGASVFLLIFLIARLFLKRAFLRRN